MDPIVPNLSPLLPVSAKVAEPPRSIATADRSLDFRAELRREVTRGQSVGETRDLLAAQDAASSTEKYNRRAPHSGAEKAAVATLDGQSSPADSPDSTAIQTEETDHSDEPESSEETSMGDSEVGGPPTDHEDEPETINVGSQDITGALQIAIGTQARQEAATEISLANESPPLTEGAEDQILTPPNSEIPQECDAAATVAGEEPSELAEASLQVVPSSLHRSSRARELEESVDGHSNMQGAGSASGPVAIPEDMAVTEVGDAPTEDDRPDSSSLNSELASQSSADELDVTINATDVDTAVERTEGAALETRSGDTRSNPAISQDRATVSSQQVGAKSTLDESQSPQVDPSRFVSRVSRAFEAANSRGGAVQLRLSPPELGAMRVELSVQQGVLSAHLETETAAAKSLLIDNLPALRERLAAMDIRVERFDVDVRQDSTGGQPDWQAQQDSRNHHREHTEAVRGRGHQSTPRESLTEVARPSSPYDATGRFNAIA